MASKKFLIRIIAVILTTIVSLFLFGCYEMKKKSSASENIDAEKIQAKSDQTLDNEQKLDSLTEQNNDKSTTGSDNTRVTIDSIFESLHGSFQQVEENQATDDDNDINPTSPNWEPTIPKLLPEQCIYVSTTGSDKADGTKDSPYKSLQRAFEQAEQLSDKNKELQIILRGGNYNITKGININKLNNLLVSAQPNEEVTLSGGLEISLKDFKFIKERALLKRIQPEHQKKIVALDLSKYGITLKSWEKRFTGHGGWPEIYIDGIPYTISQWPNDGYAKVGKVITNGGVISSITGNNAEMNDDVGTFKYLEDRQNFWNTESEIYLSGYFAHKWYHEIVRVRSIDTDTKQITLDSNTKYGLKGLTGGFYRAINIMEELDTPHEYVLDQNRNMLYIYLPKFDRNMKVCTPFLEEPIFNVNNSGRIIFKNLNLEYVNSSICIVKNSKNVVFDSCKFRNSNNNAFYIKGGDSCGLVNCEISQIGASGIILDGGNRSTLEPAGHFVWNSHIHDFSRLKKSYAPAVRLSGVGNIANNNYIHNAPHAALIFGGNDHSLAHNLIERVCLDTSDAGAIYCGRNWTLGGNIIHGNYIKDLGNSGDDMNNWTIYMDDMASGVTITNNISDNDVGFLLGGGRNLIVKNNILMNSNNKSISFDSRGTGWVLSQRPWLKKPNGIMWKRLEEVPFQKEPWKSRFPYLSKLEEDAANEPRNNILVGNILANSTEPSIHELVAKYGDIHSNTTIDDPMVIKLNNGTIISNYSITDFISGMKVGQLTTK